MNVSQKHWAVGRCACLWIAAFLTTGTALAERQRVDLLYAGASPEAWTWTGAGDNHVTAAISADGPTQGAVLRLSDSRHDDVPAGGAFVCESPIGFTARRVPNHATVYIGAWVRSEGKLVQTQPDSGVEVRLRLTSPYNHETYWSNSTADLANSLTFGFNLRGSTPLSRLGPTWKYYEFPVRVGDSGWAGGWTGVRVEVSSRVGARGDLAAGFEGTICVAEPVVRIMCPTVDAGDPDVDVAAPGFTFRLDSSAGCALAGFETATMSVDSGRRFPTFVAYDKRGEPAIFPPDDPSWRVTRSQEDNACVVRYERTGLAVDVRYEVGDGVGRVTVHPTDESSYKLVAVNDGGEMLSLRDDGAFILAPYAGGELIELGGVTHERAVSQEQNWWYNASFVAIGDRRGGVILRAPGYGAAWAYGAQGKPDALRLTCGAESYFRPAAPLGMKAPLVDPAITFEFRAVADVNGDGDFDWVDLGVAYREAYIPPNPDPDPDLSRGLVGKLDVCEPYKNPLNYDQLLEKIKQLQSLSQVWWIVGAHTSPDHDFCHPPSSSTFDPAWRGDYFAFRDAAKAYNARISLYDVAQDIREDMPRWPRAVRLRSDGKPLVTAWDSYNRCLSDPTLRSDLKDHFDDWRVKPGDTWHFDVLTAEPPREDYNPQFWATYGSDQRARIALLQYVKSLGIHITSEGLQEGMHEYCDLAWHARVASTQMGEFPGDRHVPLLPVLFLGRSVYGLAYSIPRTLLYGGRYLYEGTDPPVQALLDSYPQQIQPWEQIAHRAVRDIDQTETGWVVQYDPPATLRVDADFQSFQLDVPDHEEQPVDPQGASQ